MSHHHHHGEEDWIILVDEDNQEYRYSLERTLEMDDKKYVILIPEIQENPDEEEAHVFRLETDANNDEILVDVDEEELEKIQALLEAENADLDLIDDDSDLEFEDEDENEAVDSGSTPGGFEQSAGDGETKTDEE
ncbi:DUF1292 domain-containing protein [Capillibacterium thermochitinicola]|uniref:DUF1292 domain-containing protein n=1 Tax=Capillibacterium thermochitinicola TaxID=2699427 RepID=A0A8J6HZ84_9FIRM|nr:DUF1292 domain-containing protein [Capillibacterium thermochitinicola]MBA2132083.1 DUF1292 domain-containing protein [Capillibacterium thermochitinicola]